MIAPGRKPSLHRSLEYSFWEAPAAPESDHFWGSFEIASGKPSLPPGRVAFVGDDLRAAEELGLLANPPQLVQALDQLRVTKTPYEVECLAEANRRAAVGHEQLRKLFHGGDRAELELHLAFLGATRQDDAETPYKNIVALGKHAATLHHIAYEKRAQPAGSLLVDAGASFAGYGSDITHRTGSWWPASKRCSSGSAARCASGCRMKSCTISRTVWRPGCCATSAYRDCRPTSWSRAGLPAPSIRTGSGTHWDCSATTSVARCGRRGKTIRSCAIRPRSRSTRSSPSSRGSISSTRCSIRCVARRTSTGNWSTVCKHSAACASRTTSSSGRTASAI